MNGRKKLFFLILEKKKKSENEAVLFICGKIKNEGFQFRKGHRCKKKKKSAIR